MDELKDLDLSKLTEEQETAALLLAARAANWAIRHAKTKFTPEQQEKIYAEAIRRFREKAMAGIHSTAKADNAE